MTRSLVELIKSAAQKLPSIESPEFGACFDSFGKARVVLLGDSRYGHLPIPSSNTTLTYIPSHGTSEFYRARAAITQRLIEKHNFNIVAIEGDWPDAHAIDRFVRQTPVPKALEREPMFKHFPRWMWRNTEVQEFVTWLEKRNAALPFSKRAGFYGLDLYSMGASIRAILEYLERKDPETAEVAKRRYACLQPWAEDPQKYGLVALTQGYAPCEKEVVKMLNDLLKKRLELARKDGEDFLDAEFNARVVRDAERYYRAMYYGGAESWNCRDIHMFDTLMRLMKYSPGSKAVVWAHNSHVGDARFTAMGSRGELNIGQLCRQYFIEPGAVAIIGCSTHTGTVAASDSWDMPMKIKDVKPSREDSYEILMHNTGIPSFLLDLKRTPQNEEIVEALENRREERFIGVVYKSDLELWSHYMKAILPKQFDALVWFDRTTAVHAFEAAQPAEALSAEDTYPFGL